MNELTNEEVLHIAHLSRIHIDEDEIDKYRCELRLLMDEIDKVSKVNVDENDYMISPSENMNIYRSDEGLISNDDILSNVPKKNGNYIEIKRFVNE